MTLDWLNTNSVRNYPIKDGLSRVSDDGLFTIPNSLIVDMTLCSSQLGDSPDLYISEISVNSTTLIIEISASGTGVFGMFSSSLPLSDYNTDLAMTPGPLFPDATGMVTIGTGNDLTGLPYGSFTFGYGASALLMRVYSPGNAGLSWMSFTDAQGNESTLTGYVQIQGNSNVQFREVSGVVYVDAGENLGLNKVCTNSGTPIYSINGITPDQTTGNFTLIADQCVSLTDAQYGVVISNSCGQPCLGCAAIDTLTTQVNGLETSVINLKNVTDSLQAAINQATTLLSYSCPA